MQTLLELKDVNFSYHSVSGETFALSDISFQVNDGEFIAIVGPSGCGKSTLLSLISGLLKPESGSILLNGKDVKEAHTNIGYMLQKDHLFEWRTIYHNVLLGLEIQKKITEESKAMVDQMLKDYGLYKFKDKKPSELSGGMRQRAALIRTLALQPELLLLDEPFSALDYQTRLSVCDDISSILKKAHKTAILVTHDLSEAISVADRIIVLTKRPAKIKSIVPVHMSIEDRTPMKSRNAPEFKDYFNQIWKELNVNE
ncbi:ABC transporter ATP-binding protein [uncultured Robinsoniella sp.]|uniref:ABC transporter ATP-binding protein n=1 Tax=uncultured Robinsoniella sp. TaxID=904190 RepID=UPI00374E3D78